MAKLYLHGDAHRFGWELGNTLTSHEKPECPIMKMGANFANGFLKGAKVGEFDIETLTDCLKKEPTADKLFYGDEIKMKKAFETRD